MSHRRPTCGLAKALLSGTVISGRHGPRKECDVFRESLEAQGSSLPPDGRLRTAALTSHPRSGGTVHHDVCETLGIYSHFLLFISLICGWKVLLIALEGSREGRTMTLDIVEAVMWSWKQLTVGYTP